MARDRYHDLVRLALEQENWQVTHDPLVLEAGVRNVNIDLGAEKLIGAERGTEKIAIEIKSFLNPSPMTDFYHALG